MGESAPYSAGFSYGEGAISKSCGAPRAYPEDMTGDLVVAIRPLGRQANFLREDKGGLNRTMHGPTGP